MSRIRLIKAYTWVGFRGNPIVTFMLSMFSGRLERTVQQFSSASITAVLGHIRRQIRQLIDQLRYQLDLRHIGRRIYDPPFTTASLCERKVLYFPGFRHIISKQAYIVFQEIACGIEPHTGNIGFIIIPVKPGPASLSES